MKIRRNTSLTFLMFPTQNGLLRIMSWHRVITSWSHEMTQSWCNKQATENYLGPIFGYIAKNFFVLYVFQGIWSTQNQQRHIPTWPCTWHNAMSRCLESWRLWHQIQLLWLYQQASIPEESICFSIFSIISNIIHTLHMQRHAGRYDRGHPSCRHKSRSSLTWIAWSSQDTHSWLQHVSEASRRILVWKNKKMN